METGVFSRKGNGRPKHFLEQRTINMILIFFFPFLHLVSDSFILFCSNVVYTFFGQFFGGVCFGLGNYGFA